MIGSRSIPDFDPVDQDVILLLDARRRDGAFIRSYFANRSSGSARMASQSPKRSNMSKAADQCPTRTVGSPDSIFRSVGTLTPIRAANTAWVSFRLKRSLLSREPRPCSFVSSCWSIASPFNRCHNLHYRLHLTTIQPILFIDYIASLRSRRAARKQGPGSVHDLCFRAKVDLMDGLAS